MAEESSFYVVDEDRVAVVGGPFTDQDDAANDARERAPGHIVVAERVLNMIEGSSEQTVRWETGEDDVDIVTDGGVVQEQTGVPEEVPEFWDELSLTGKRIYLEEDATKNEALILVVHELGLDVDTSQINTSDSLVQTDALGEVLSKVVRTTAVPHRFPDEIQIDVEADQYLYEEEDVKEGDHVDDGGNKDTVDNADEDEIQVPERSVAEDLQEEANGADESIPISDAFEGADNIGDSVIGRLEDAGYTHIADLEAATEEELKENVSYVGRNKAQRIMGFVQEDTEEETDDEDDPEPDEDDEEEPEEVDEGDEDDHSVEPADFEKLDTPSWLDESSFYQAAEISDGLADFESTLGWDEGHERLAELVEATGVDVEVSI